MEKRKRIGLAIAGAAVAAALVVLCVRGFGKAKPMVPPEPLSAAGRTASKVAERLNDKEYMAKLKELGERQQVLAQAKAEAEARYGDWLKTHGPSAVSTNGIPNEAEGLALKGALDEAVLAQEEHQKLVAAVIGDRLRRQADEHAGEEAAAAAKFRAAHSKYGEAGPPKAKPAKRAPISETVTMTSSNGTPVVARRLLRPDKPATGMPTPPPSLSSAPAPTPIPTPSPTPTPTPAPAQGAAAN